MADNLNEFKEAVENYDPKTNSTWTWSMPDQDGARYKLPSPLKPEMALSKKIQAALTLYGSKDGAVRALQGMAKNGYSQFSAIVIEESDFAGGQLKKNDLFKEFVSNVGEHAYADIGDLRKQFDAALEGARAGETRDISYEFSVAHTYSQLKGYALADDDAKQHFGPDFIQRWGHLAGQWNAIPPEISRGAAAELTSFTVSSAAMAFGLARALPAVVPSTPRQARQTGPVAGGGAKVENLNPTIQAKIQEFADKHGVEVTVIGSRARGEAGPLSDFDYIIEGNNRLRGKAARELPRGPGDGGRPRIEIHDGKRVPLDPSRPHIQFTPRREGTSGS